MTHQKSTLAVTIFQPFTVEEIRPLRFRDFRKSIRTHILLIYEWLRSWPEYGTIAKYDQVWNLFISAVLRQFFLLYANEAASFFWNYMFSPYVAFQFQWKTLHADEITFSAVEFLDVSLNGEQQIIKKPLYCLNSTSPLVKGIFHIFAKNLNFYLMMRHSWSNTFCWFSRKIFTLD